MPSHFNDMDDSALIRHLVEKHAQDRDAGFDRLASSDPYPCFTGWGDVPKTRTLFAISLVRGEGDGVEPIARHIRARTGFGFKEAGKDYPLHVTGGQIAHLATDEQVKSMCASIWTKIYGLFEIPFTFNRCYVTKTGEVLLTSTVLPEPFREARRWWWKTCESVLGAAPIDYDLMHISLLRVTSVPGPDDYGRSEFVKRLAEVDYDLRRNPLMLQVSGIYIGSTYEYITLLEKGATVQAVA